MNIRQITSPRNTYDGYFESYFIRPFFHLFANFSGHESGRSCFLSILAWITVSLGIAGIMMGQIGLIGPEAGISSSIVVGIIWIAFSITPLAALIIRATHGPDPQHRIHARFLGVDTLLAVSCILFFFLGLLMMITTLNSEILNPNARYVPEDDTLSLKQDYVVEEPIFTYQDETPVAVEEPVDSIPGVPAEELASPDESFDPTLEKPDEAIIDEPDSDSI